MPHRPPPFGGRINRLNENTEATHRITSPDMLLRSPSSSDPRGTRTPLFLATLFPFTILPNFRAVHQHTRCTLAALSVITFQPLLPRGSRGSDFVNWLESSLPIDRYQPITNHPRERSLRRSLSNHPNASLFTTLFYRTSRPTRKNPPFESFLLIPDCLVSLLVPSSIRRMFNDAIHASQRRMSNTLTAHATRPVTVDNARGLRVC